ncbi:hypothetical protein [Actinobacillus vicugnae]|uniref:hypothetical protein n=1 Tax=Actinobacillus vicugnae TaxID=2573093 RepID=UPI001242045B|nr:hypothetical protein [Actinobacillus vicugnae]
MKLYTIASCFLCLAPIAFAAHTTVQSEHSASDNRIVTAQTEPQYSRNLIVFFDAEMGDQALLQTVETQGYILLYHYNMLKAIAIHIPDTKSIKAAIRQLVSVKGVIGVNQDQVLELN